MLLRRSRTHDSTQCCFSRVHVYYLLITGVLQTFGYLPVLSLFDRTTVEVLLSTGAHLKQVDEVLILDLY